MKEELEILLDKTEEYKIKKLDLGNFELKSIPKRVLEFDWLEELSFGKYYDFSQTEWVNNGKCTLEKLPKELVKLKSLNTLILAGSPFGSSKPELIDFEVIWQLTSLKKLVLDSTKITNIDRIKGLPHIYYLGLSNTDVKNFSPIANATKLQTLTIAGNEIESVGFLKKLESIKNISLSSNKLSNLNGLENKHHLKRLCICENNLTNIDQLYKTNNLEYLCIRGCYRPTRGDVAKHLTKLKIFSTSGNHELEEISENVNLKEIDMQNVTTSDLAKLREFKHCEELTLYGSFEELTPLSGLMNLKSLTLVSHKLNSLSNLEFPNLISLSIITGNLNSLSGIQNLKTLKSIELEDLPLTTIEEIEKLEELESFSLTNTKVSSLQPLVEQIKSKDKFNLTWYENPLPTELDSKYNENGLQGIIEYYENKKS